MQPQYPRGFTAYSALRNRWIKDLRPNSRHAIFSQDGIRRDHRNLFFKALRDQQAIKWITVMLRKRLDSSDRLKRDGQQLEPIELHCFCTNAPAVSGSVSLPIAALMAISQTEAWLTKTTLLSSAIIFDALRGRACSPLIRHKNACVSSSTRIGSDIRLEAGGYLVKILGELNHSLCAAGFSFARGNGHKLHHGLAMFGDHNFLTRDGSGHEAGE
jgi:hypothetical protein